MRCWIALLLLPLAACTSGGQAPKTFGTDIENYLPGEAKMLAAAGGVQLILVGSPFGIHARKTTMASVSQKIEDGSHDVPFKVLPIEEGAAPAHARVVIALNANTHGSKLCGALPEERAASGAASDVVLSAAFCRGDKRISSTEGRATGLTGPDDPNFQRLISQVAGEIFPSPTTLMREQERPDGLFWVLP